MNKIEKMTMKKIIMINIIIDLIEKNIIIEIEKVLVTGKKQKNI